MNVKKLTSCLAAAAMACSIALTGCGSTIDANAVGATLNGKEISLGFMNFMAKFQQASYDPMYVSYFGTDYWSQEVSEGMTMEDSTKKSIADNLELLYLLEEHMADYQVEISEEETEAMKEAAKQFLADNSEKAVKQMGATEEYAQELLRLYTIQQKMRTAITAEAEVEVTDEEAAQRTFSYFRVSATSKTDSEGNSTDYTEEEKTALAAAMKEAAAAAKEDFEGTAEKNEYTVSTYSYGKDETSMDEAVIKAADALKEGEVSDLITTDSYFYVIRLDSELDEEKTAEKKESLTEQKKTEYYNGICDGYKEAATYEINESNWAKVKFDKLFGAPAQEETDSESKSE